MSVTIEHNVCIHQEFATTNTAAAGTNDLTIPTLPFWISWIRQGATQIYDLTVATGDFTNNIGQHVFNILEDQSPNPPTIYGSLVINIEDCHEVTWDVCQGDYKFQQLYFPFEDFQGPPGGSITLITDLNDIPDWFIVALDGPYYEFTAEGADQSTLIVTFEEKDRFGSHLRFFDVTVNISACFPVVDQCGPFLLNIVWLNRCGFWRNYLFPGIREIGIDVGGSVIWKDANDILKWQSIRDVYDSILWVSGVIPKDHVDFVAELKISIQAYIRSLIPPNGPDQYISILIDKGSFKLYRDKDRLFRYDFKFRLATEKIIQSQ